MPITQLKATVIPPSGLAPGSQYQLIFATAGTRDATSSDIADYNAFVTGEAALNPLLPAATWHAVASTLTVDAQLNAPSSGLPVYNTLGILVAPALPGLYVSDGVFATGHSGPVEFDQFGGAAFGGESDFPWTGSANDGTAYIPLGGPGGSSNFGNPTGNGDWLLVFGVGVQPYHPQQLSGRLYALSTAITVPTPEPVTITLLGSALLVIGGHRLLRWRRKR